MVLKVRITKHYNREIDCLESYIEQNEIVTTSQDRFENLITYHFW